MWSVTGTRRINSIHQLVDNCQAWVTRRYRRQHDAAFEPLLLVEGCLAEFDPAGLAVGVVRVGHLLSVLPLVQGHPSVVAWLP